MCLFLVVSGSKLAGSKNRLVVTGLVLGGRGGVLGLACSRGGWF